MKKILLYISFLFVTTSLFAQQKIGSEGNIISTGNYPSVKSKDVKGGVHFFQTITDRNNLPANFRDTGMIAYVFADTTYYTLKHGITNSDWQEWKSGADGDFIPLSQKAANNGVATLDNGGKVPLSQLPAITTNQPSYVIHLSEMLANDSASVGDIIVVGDSSKSYVLMQVPPSNFDNWLELESPIPTNTDLLPEGENNLYYTDARARDALHAGAGITYDPLTGTINAIGGGSGSDSTKVDKTTTITINGVTYDLSANRSWIVAGEGSGNTKYVLQGYGTKIDSSGANYTINADTSILVKKTDRFPIGVRPPLKAIDSTTLGLDSLKLTEIRYSLAARDTTKWTDSTIIDKKYFIDRLTSYTPGSGTDTTSLSNRIDAKLNISDTSAMLSPYLPKINLDGGTSGQVLSKNSSTNQDYSWTSVSSGGTDSSAIHVGYITTPGDTAIVFSDLKGNSDTVSITLLHFWKRNGNNLYYKDGNIIIGADTGHAKLIIRSDSLGNTYSALADTAGILLSNNYAATSTLKMQSSPPIVLSGNAWGTAAGASQKIKFRIFNEAITSTVASGVFTLQSSQNGGDYSTVFTVDQVGGVTTNGNLFTKTINASGVRAGSYTAIGSTSGVYIGSLVPVYSYTGSLSNTGSAPVVNLNVYDAKPTISNTGGSTYVRGFYYDPVNNNLTGTISIGFENLTGHNYFNTTSGNTGFGIPDSIAPATKVEIKGAITFQTQTEPADPANGSTVEWFDGTNKKYKKNVGGTVTSGIIY